MEDKFWWGAIRMGAVEMKGKPMVVIDLAGEATLFLRAEDAADIASNLYLVAEDARSRRCRICTVDHCADDNAIILNFSDGFSWGFHRDNAGDLAAEILVTAGAAIGILRKN